MNQEKSYLEENKIKTLNYVHGNKSQRWMITFLMNSWILTELLKLLFLASFAFSSSSALPVWWSGLHKREKAKELNISTSLLHVSGCVKNGNSWWVHSWLTRQFLAQKCITTVKKASLIIALLLQSCWLHRHSWALELCMPTTIIKVNRSLSLQPF